MNTKSINIDGLLEGSECPKCEAVNTREIDKEEKFGDWGIVGYHVHCHKCEHSYFADITDNDTIPNS